MIICSKKMNSHVVVGCKEGLKLETFFQKVINPSQPVFLVEIILNLLVKL